MPGQLPAGRWEKGGYVATAVSTGSLSRSLLFPPLTLPRTLLPWRGNIESNRLCLPWDWLAAAQQRPFHSPFHRHRGCSGCFCFPLAAQESRQRNSGWPSPREQGSPGYRSLPQVSGTAGCRLPAALLPGSLPALLGPGLGTGVGSQPQGKHVDTRTGRGEKGLMDGWMDKQMGYGRAGMVLCIQGASVTCSRAASKPGSFQ